MGSSTSVKKGTSLTRQPLPLLRNLKIQQLRRRIDLKEMQQNQPKHHDSAATLLSFDSCDPLVMSSDPTCQPLVDLLLVQVEAQETVIGNISKLCDVVDAVWTAQEEKMKQSVLDLPIWAHTPGELISTLCTE